MAQDVNALEAVGIAAEPRRTRSLGHALAPWKKRPLGVFGAIVILILIFLAIFAPMVAPNDPYDFVGGRLESPNSEFLLGTNNLGQDVFSRAIYGAQISVAVGLAATILGVGAGTVIGVTTGYVGGWVDLLTQRVLEILASFPGLFLALIVIVVLGRPGNVGTNVFAIGWELKSIEVAIALAFLFGTVRIIRSAVLTERNMTYITAAQSIGVSSSRLLWRHILPNVLPYAIVSFTTIIGLVILIEAALSFLGYGTTPGTPSWGADLSNRNREFFTQAPWIMVGPGVALSMAILGFNFLGDALRDILDPRLRGSR
jgi:peptide/nickel transport system permease protein